jgi:hypothetical protein
LYTSDNFIYTLKHKNIDVADITIDSSGLLKEINTVYSEEHIPPGIIQDNYINTSNLNAWWKYRGIPSNREYYDVALSILKVKTSSELLLNCYGLSLTDHYWVKPKESNATWEAVNFYDNSFSNDIGAVFFREKNKIDTMASSPDSALKGRLVKRWEIRNNKRILVKGGSDLSKTDFDSNYVEPYNEVLASMIAEKINVPHIKYDLEYKDNKPYSLCYNFTDNNTEFISDMEMFNSEPWAAMKNDRYSHFYIVCKNNDIKNAIDFMNRMLLFDYLILNIDRHWDNFGFLRDSESLKDISFGPLFDSGTSFWYNTELPVMRPEKPFDSKTFKGTLYDQLKYVTDYTWLDLNKLNRFGNTIKEYLMNTKTISKGRAIKTGDLFEMRVDNLKKYIDTIKNHKL